MVESSRFSNLFKHLCMSSVPAKIKIQSMKTLDWPQNIFHCKSMMIFPHAQGQLTPLSDMAEIRTLSRLYGCPSFRQNVDDPAKNEGAVVATIFPHYNSMGYLLP